MRHFIAKKLGTIEPDRILYSDVMARSYRDRGGWEVTGPYVLEAHAIPGVPDEEISNELEGLNPANRAKGLT
jgi:hypothetical protein